MRLIEIDECTYVNGLDVTAFYYEQNYESRDDKNVRLTYSGVRILFKNGKDIFVAGTNSKEVAAKINKALGEVSE